MTIPKVAVLLATYNGGEFLSDQVISLLNQKGIDLQIFVSDDCSTDNTLSTIESLRSTKINVLPVCSRFGSAGQNFFRLFRDVNFDNFDYVSLADQDDIWFDEKLLNSIYSMNEFEADAYSGNVLAFWPDGKERLVIKSQPQCDYDYLFEAAGPGCTYVFTSGLAKTIQNFLIENIEITKKIWLHDWFFYAYTRSMNKRWFIDNNFYMLYRQHSTNQVGVNRGIAAYISRLSKIRSGHFFEQTKLLSKVLAQDSFRYVSYPFGFWKRIVFVFNINKFRRSKRDRLALALFVLFGIAR